jgi:diaminohydroxyphosphoribosylaminopyrimidine deaminase/5-amino-6-(5-phosphoribosylamino)uracil reductase
VAGDDQDAGFMRAALGLARRSLGRVWPNPAVGCVLVADGRVVARGSTGDGGRPHAEAVALARAGAAARGATAYVSLEPCAHTGRAPPCSDGLIAAGVVRVVAAHQDPDPRVNGRGFARLQAAGVAVEVGCLAEEARALNRGFLTRVTEGRPMLTLKLAASLDGRIATASGESRWITGAAARAEVHLMRAQADAVLVGAGTARADDPVLDVRGIGIARPDLVRVVAARGLDLPTGGRLAATAAAQPLWLCHGPEAEEGRRADWAARGAVLIEVPAGQGGGLDPAALMRVLGARGLTRVLCEGGGALAAGLLAAGQVDEIVAYAAGMALGAEGLPAVGPLAVAALAGAPRFRLAGVDAVGPDIRSRWLRA